MDFGVVSRPTRQLATSCRPHRRRGHGFRYGWTFDSCVLWQEPFVIYSQVLAATNT